MAGATAAQIGTRSVASPRPSRVKVARTSNSRSRSRSRSSKRTVAPSANVHDRPETSPWSPRDGDHEPPSWDQHGLPLGLPRGQILVRVVGNRLSARARLLLQSQPRPVRVDDHLELPIGKGRPVLAPVLTLPHGGMCELVPSTLGLDGERVDQPDSTSKLSRRDLVVIPVLAVRPCRRVRPRKPLRHLEGDDL